MSEVESPEKDVKIELRSNRIFMVVTFATIAAVCCAFVVIFGIVLTVAYDINGLICLIVMLVLGLFTAGVAIGFRFYRGTQR